MTWSKCCKHTNRVFWGDFVFTVGSGIISWSLLTISFLSPISGTFRSVRLFSTLPIDLFLQSLQGFISISEFFEAFYDRVPRGPGQRTANISECDYLFAGMGEGDVYEHGCLHHSDDRLPWMKVMRRHRIYLRHMRHVPGTNRAAMMRKSHIGCCDCPTLASTSTSKKVIP